ncbi:MAG: cysteine--tRNA ligase [Patescibacteria group bacterium]|nr:cysteine--tRNA ligase [Patescibacteria group bacterium]
MALKIYNSLTKKEEIFKPIKPGRAGLYTCGPTVYSYVQIGNWRTYILSDLIFRTLEYLGYKVDYVINITDVGHLTGDNSGDADTGEDRLEKAAKKERKTAWQIAEFYTNDFLEGFDKLNLKRPKVFSKATDHIQDQIDLISKIEKRGFTYKTSDGIYFDTVAFEKAGNVYGQMSSLDQIKEGARVERNLEKRNPRDFALWKFSPKDKKRDMEWDSPWGVGFPGWHIECSAMSMKYLGDQFDIHTGGEDLLSTHHPNEIAQSEAATGKKPFVKFWVHGAFLLVDGGRMGKSLGNAYNLHDLEEKGYSPLDLRYFYLTGHYHKQLNFTWETLKSAKESRLKLLSLVSELESGEGRGKIAGRTSAWRESFTQTLEDNLNLPQALAIVWETARNKDFSGEEKLELLFDFDRILGLGLETFGRIQNKEVPVPIKKLAEKRDRLRKSGDWHQADIIRKEIESRGFRIEDCSDGSRVLPKISS